MTDARQLAIRLAAASLLAMGTLHASPPAEPSVDMRVSVAAAHARRGDLIALKQAAQGIEHALLRSLRTEWPSAIADERDPSRRRYMQKSLAALGDTEARAVIRDGMASRDLMRLRAAFVDAAEVGGNDMIVAAAEQLASTVRGGRPIGPDGVVHTDVAIAAPRHQAVILLSKLVTDPSAPRIDLDRILYDEADVDRWKTWWATHGASYR